jgi:hypothetical protein
LGNRAEAALTGDPHLVAALDRALHLPLHGKAGAEGLLQLPLTGGAPGELARELEPAGGGDDQRLDAVAHLHIERTVLVLQLLDGDRGLSLAPDVEERDVGPDGDDRPLHGIAFLDPLRLLRSLEHAGEILVLLRHACSLDEGATL